MERERSRETKQQRDWVGPVLYFVPWIVGIFVAIVVDLSIRRHAPFLAAATIANEAASLALGGPVTWALRKAVLLSLHVNLHITRYGLSPLVVEVWRRRSRLSTVSEALLEKVVWQDNEVFIRNFQWWGYRGDACRIRLVAGSESGQLALLEVIVETRRFRPLDTIRIDCGLTHRIIAGKIFASESDLVTAGYFY